MLFSKKHLRLYVVLLTSILTITFTCVGYWLYSTVSIYDMKELGADIYVGSVSGLNADTDAVHFGVVPPGGKSHRKMTVTAGKYRSLVTMEYSGTISEWVHVSDNNFILEPFEGMDVNVVASVPEDAENPSYRDGSLRIIFRKV